MIGQRLSHYVILEKIGGGGQGDVYRARDERLPRDVAIKVLPPGTITDATRRRFRKEALALSRVNHPHIETVYEFDTQADVDFLVLELVGGVALAERLRTGPIPEREVARLGAQLAGGLAAAHREGILHLDIKPGNLRLTPDGQLKVLDFGLAKLVQIGAEEKTQSVTEAGRVAGTLPYMAPEQLRGERVDERMDLYAAGAVLYEMATGRRAFPQTQDAQLVTAILHENPPAPSTVNRNISQALDRIILKALDKEPERRYQSARELAVDLERLSAPTRGLVFSRVRQPTRKWRSVAVWTLLAISGVVGGGLILLRSSRGPKPPAPARPVHARSEIAVLPFQNLSAKGSNAYFAVGLHDELLTQLAKVAALKVISRTSVMGYQGTSKLLKQIGRELGVGSVVEGSVQVEGERLRVNVQLIDAATDEHLWTERYDRTLDDAFAIQSEVAQQIVAAVGAALTSAEQGRLAAPPTANGEAYRLYLLGREYWRRPGYLRQDRETAQQLYERALGLDSSFALARAALSQAHGQMYFLRYDPSAARAARQREEAEAALRLAPALPQAHIAMGMAHYYGRRDYLRALDEYAIALKGLPNDAELWGLIGYVHRRLGNWDKVFTAFEKAAKLDPRDVTLFSDLGGNTYGSVRRYADAVRAYDWALSLAPDQHFAAIKRGWTYFRWQGQLDTLRATLSRLPRDADLEAGGSVAETRAQLLLLERNAGGLLQMLQVGRVDVFVTQTTFLPGALYAAWAQQLRGDRAAARTAFGSALVRLDSALREFPDDGRVHAARGMALAGLGRRDQALREARWLRQSVVYRKDALQGPGVGEVRAQILAQAGDTEAALDEIERLLARPSKLSLHELRLDPRWDPIRDHPRFRALLARHAGP